MDAAYWVASTPSFATCLRRIIGDLRAEPKPQVRASQALAKRCLAGGFSQRSEIVEKLLAHGAVRLAASRTRVRRLSEKPVPRRGFLVEIRPSDLLESQALIQGGPRYRKSRTGKKSGIRRARRRDCKRRSPYRALLMPTRHRRRYLEPLTIALRRPAAEPGTVARALHAKEPR